MHHPLHSKQSCVLGRAGLSVISMIQVRTVRLRGKNPRPQHQREVESEPLPWSVLTPLRGSMNPDCPRLWGYPHPKGSQRRSFPYSKCLSFLVKKKSCSTERGREECEDPVPTRTPLLLDGNSIGGDVNRNNKHSGTSGGLEVRLQSAAFQSEEPHSPACWAKDQAETSPSGRGHMCLGLVGPEWGTHPNQAVQTPMCLPPGVALNGKGEGHWPSASAGAGSHGVLGMVPDQRSGAGSSL